MDAIADYQDLFNTDERIVEETIDVPIPQVTEETVEVAKHIPREWVQIYTVEQFVAVPVPWIRAETVEVIHFTPQDRISDRLEQTVDVAVPARDSGTNRRNEGGHP